MLTLICGFPKAGKTTYSRQYEDKYIVLHLDELGSYQKVLQRLNSITNDVIIEGVYYNIEERIKVLQTYKGDKTKCIYLNTSEEIRKQRTTHDFIMPKYFNIPTYDEGWNEIIIITDNKIIEPVKKPDYTPEQVLNFIRRFPDANWLTGNCYYFAVILKNRFNEGEIYYDVIDGHFVFKLNQIFYDWTGIVDPIKPISWNKFKFQYDRLQYEKILQNCIL